MSKRAGAAVALKPKAKAKPKFTWANVEKFDDHDWWESEGCKTPCLNPEHRSDDTGSGPFLRMGCCGIVEFEGTTEITSIADAFGIRRAAWLFGRSGYVIATPTDLNFRVDSEIARTEPFFRGAGWKKLGKFKNPRTGNLIQIWGAKTLSKGGTSQ